MAWSMKVVRHEASDFKNQMKQSDKFYDFQTNISYNQHIIVPSSLEYVTNLSKQYLSIPRLYSVAWFITTFSVVDWIVLYGFACMRIIPDSTDKVSS